jgi:hypothetical protein
MERRINKALYDGFFAFTPFLRSEFVGSLLVFLMSLLVRLGWKAMAAKAHETRKLLALLEEQAIMTHTGHFRGA